MYTLSIKKYIAILTSPFNITFGSVFLMCFFDRFVLT